MVFDGYWRDSQDLNHYPLLLTCTRTYLMTTVAPLVAAVVAGLTARLVREGPLGGIPGSHAENEHFFVARARAPP
eukprot:SAG11_NODE_149_length_14661_cov_10.031658_6_plen_75_part_00